MGHFLWALLGIFGVLISSSGWLGKDRLDRWNAAVERRILGKESIPAKMHSWFWDFAQKGDDLATWLWGAGFLILIVVGIGWLGLQLFAHSDANLMGNALHWQFHLSQFLALGSIFFIFIPAYLASFLCHILLELLLAPYRITHCVEQKDVLQRTLQLVGAGIAIFGILGSFLQW
jgi:hypothetical protein